MTRHNFAASEIGAVAAHHGLELLQHGFTVHQVVHHYGDLCQAITEMAVEYRAPVSAEEFQTLNRCLDNAVADAVSEYSFGREMLVTERGLQSLNEQLGFLAHELRNLIHTATLAFAAVKRGKVGAAGETGALVDRSLLGMANLINRTLADVRLAAQLPAYNQLISVADLIAEVHISASLAAEARQCNLLVAVVDPRLAVDVDRDLLVSAIGNLLQNAFKFTARSSTVCLRAYGAADRVRVDVEDQCGGLPLGFAKTMFQPFTQGGFDKSGLGLGLSICRRTVEANKGTLNVRDLPGRGCMFTIELPRHTMPTPLALSNSTIQ